MNPIRPLQKHQEEQLVVCLSKVNGLVAAYLFGSRARGNAKASSDIDVGLWLERTPTSFDDFPFELAGDLEQTLEVPVDVVVLNSAPSDLVHRVLRDGVLLIEHNRSLRIRLEVHARNDYFDLAPIRRTYRHGRRDVRS